MKLSIVATLYESAPYVESFYRSACAAARQLVGDEEYEIVLVNDGSPDNSLELAVRLQEHEPNLVVVDLSRNFGHHRAMMTGLAYARGDRVFLIDSDLEEDPEWLLPFDDQMTRESCDVVFGVQVRRKGGWFERWSGLWYYRLFRFVTGLAVPENMVTARIMTRRYVDALLQHKEREFDIGGLWYITGFEQNEHPVVKTSSSSTTYTLGKKISLFTNSVTSFSNLPLIYISRLGIVMSIGALLFMTYLVFNWLFLDRPPSGWTSVMASIWLIGGWVVLSVGIVGIYLSKIFLEVKSRPYSIIRHLYRNGNEDGRT